MSFLRLAALWALPLALLPIAIHLIHRRRHPTVIWAATMFLRRAQGARRGPARLRRWLILATRVLVLLGMVLALARPLSTGAFGLSAGNVSGKRAMSIVLLDRSPSMQRRIGNAAPTRLRHAKQKVASALQTLGVEEFFLIESVGKKPIRLTEPTRLIDAPMTEPAGSTADVPAMIRDALLLISESGESVADVWICSDGQFGDWDPQAPQWESIRGRMSALGKGLRMHVLQFGEVGGLNTSVRVADVRAVETEAGQTMLLSIAVDSENRELNSIPVRFTLGEATSVAEVSLRDGRGELPDWTIPVSGEWNELYGRIAIPADINEADDQWFLVAPSETARQVILVSQDDCEAVEVALEVLADVSVVEADGLSLKRLGSVGAVVWQGDLPRGDVAKVLAQFAASGGSIVLFPPREPSAATDREFEGVSWSAERADFAQRGGQQSDYEGFQFSVDRFVPVVGPVVKISEVAEFGTVISSLAIGEGSAIFCGTDVTGFSSKFVADGAVLYGLLSAAVDDGTRRRFGAGSVSAGGELPEQFAAGAASVRPVMGGESGVGELFEFGSHPGVYAIPSGDSNTPRLIAINRSSGETANRFVSEDDLALPLDEIHWNRIPLEADSAGSESGLIQEVWAGVWLVVIVSMLVEAWLSLPRRTGGRIRSQGDSQ